MFQKSFVFLIFILFVSVDLQADSKSDRVKYWIEHLADEETHQRMRAFENLQVLGKAAVNELLKSIEDNKKTQDPRQWLKQSTVRMLSLLLITEYKSEKVTKALLKIAKNEKELVHFRMAAVVSLGQSIVNKDTEEFLQELVEYGTYKVPKYTKNIISPAGKPDYLKRAAALALGRLQSKKSKDLLYKIAKDDDAEVNLRLACFVALSELTNIQLPDLSAFVEKLASDITDGMDINNNPILLQGALLALSQQDSKSVKIQTVVDIIKNEKLSVNIRHMAIITLAILDQKNQVAVLEPLLNGENDFLKVSAASVITLFQPKHAASIETLTKIVKQRSLLSGVRAYAAITMGQLESDDVIETLKYGYLKDPDAVIRLNAANALGQIVQGKTSGMLIEGLRKRQAYVSAEAIGFLMDREITKPFLKKLAMLADNQEYYLRKKVMITLEGQTDKLSIKLLKSGLKDKNIHVKKEAILSAGMSKNETAFKKILNKLLDDEDDVLRIRAKMALKALKRGGPSPAMQKLLKARRRHTTGPTPFHEWRRLRNNFFYAALQISPYDLNQWRSRRSSGSNNINNTDTVKSTPSDRINDDDGYKTVVYYSTCGGSHAPVRYEYKIKKHANGNVTYKWNNYTYTVKANSKKSSYITNYIDDASGTPAANRRNYRKHIKFGVEDSRRYLIELFGMGGIKKYMENGSDDVEKASKSKYKVEAIPDDDDTSASHKQN